ncbi:MAG TPA: trypsin-like peptidase domain-containing protein [Nitrospira sp.]|nr:trypsin-like peptidase domain-containing protein [Nitrospira sp.]
MPQDLQEVKRLTGSEIEAIVEAIVDGYNRAGLEQALLFDWGEILENRVNVYTGLFNIATELIRWTELKGRTLDLVRLLYERNSGNPRLRQVAERYRLAASNAPRPTSLESLISTRSRFLDYDRFTSRFATFGRRVCKITTQHRTGTGTLIGPDLVLTNFHVIEEVYYAPSLATAVRCHFSGIGGADDENDLQCGLAPIPNWIVQHSLCSSSDITGTGTAGMDELDYALLRLEKNIGEETSHEGHRRGWFKLGESDPIMGRGDFIVIPQHPNGSSLQIAWGQLLEPNSTGSRFRHDATTDGGSSGALCFNTELEPFGLHHATQPVMVGTNPHYNQCIPLRLVAADLNKHQDKTHG